MTLTNEQLSELIDNYANMVIDRMDIDTLTQFAYESLVVGFNKYSEKELLSEIQELFDDETLEMLMESVANDSND